MRYVDLFAPSPHARDPLPSEAALVVQQEEVADLTALLAERGDYTLVERAQPGPDQPVMHYVRCASPLDAQRLERAWRDHRLSKFIGRAVHASWGDQGADEED